MIFKFNCVQVQKIDVFQAMQIDVITIIKVSQISWHAFGMGIPLLCL